MLEGGADCGGIGLGDDKHAEMMGGGAASGKQSFRSNRMALMALVCDGCTAERENVMLTKVGIHALRECRPQPRRGWRAYARHDGVRPARLAKTNNQGHKS